MSGIQMRVVRGSVAAWLCVTGASIALAQTSAELRRPVADNFLQQQRTIDEQLAQRRVDIAPLDGIVDWQWGGWLEYYAFLFDDGIQSQRIVQRPSLNLWTRLRLDNGAHEIFARTRFTYEAFNPGDEFDRERDWVGPNLERGWYRIDVGQALRLTEPSDPLQLRIQGGRQEVTFGTGYVLDLPLDSIVVDGQIHNFNIRGLFGRTRGSYPNIDRSVPVADHSARRFFGVEVKYSGLADHRPFVYALWQDDFTDERPKDPLQQYAYDSAYVGVGSTGSIVKNFEYWTELAYEWGESYGDGAIWRRDEIDAWAFNLGLRYMFVHKTKPELLFEYMFASGDGDRTFSPTSAAGGNTRGDDTGFVAFGFRDTGIAAAPLLSNIHVWKVGGSFYPLPEVEIADKLQIGTNWFLFHKHHRRGAISDPTAGNFDGWVGWEMDYYVNWRFASDISWTMRWGIFFPGSAFQDQGTRNFVFTGLTWSF